jgi:hypothetical protein
MSLPSQQRIGDAGSRAPCEQVAAEIGSDLELAGDPAFSDVYDKVAEQLVATYPYVEDLEGRLCNPCVIGKFCLTRQAVRQRLEITQSARETRHIVELINNSPRWLIQALLQRSGITSTELNAITRDEQTLNLAVKSGGFSVEEFLGGIDFRLGGKHYKDQLPELEKLSGISPIAEFQEILITRTDGIVFSVLECPTGRGVTNFRGEGLNISMYRLLMHKMLKSIIDDANSASGEAPIFTPNGVTQSLLSNGLVYECRKKGSKDRAYYTLHRGAGTPEDPHRVVLLGGSSGDARTQEECISSFF